MDKKADLHLKGMTDSIPADGFLNEFQTVRSHLVNRSLYVTEFYFSNRVSSKLRRSSAVFLD